MTTFPYPASNLAKFNESVKPKHVVIDGVTGKLCRKCDEWKPLDRFGRSAVTSDQLENRCKRCNADRALAYYHRNREKQRERRNQPEAREAFRKYYAVWRREREKTDLNFRIRLRLRSRLNRALKGVRKEAPTMVLVGCSVEELRTHLEQQFAPGMSWDNYGQPGWEIDHIKPCASFDLRDPEQQRKCFHFTNLQPLWGIENSRKGGRT